MVTTLLLINRRISVFYLKAESCDSPVSIVYVYRLNDQGSILGRSKGFFSFSLCVQTCSGAHPASIQ
jgi:hypothetical protein